MLPDQFPLTKVQAFFPSCCAVCQKWPAHGICSVCYGQFKEAQVHRCLQCAIDLVSEHQQICGLCLKKSFSFDQTIAAVSYVSPWKELVQGLKFFQKIEHTHIIAQLLALSLLPHLKVEEDYPDLMIPIPSARQHMQERGFNQAWEITRRLSKMLKYPINTDLHLLKKAPQSTHLKEDSQVHRKRDERFKALKNTFIISRLEALQDKHIVLVDDVMTTGATAHHAAIALKNAGARRVSVWVFARTPESHQYT